MYIIKVIIIFSFLFPLKDGKCVKNPNFIEVVMDENESTTEVILCETAKSCTLKYLTNGSTYFGCIGEGGAVGTLGIGIIEMSGASASTAYSTVRCLTDKGWSSVMPCITKPVINFVQTKIERMQFYIVICDKATNPVIFPNENQIQIQIDFIRNPTIYDKMNSIPGILSTTKTITCISQCNGIHPVFKSINKSANDSDIDPKNPSLLRLYYHNYGPNDNIDMHLMKYECASLNVETWFLQYYVANEYKPIMINNVGSVEMLQTIDAGTELRCTYFASLKTKSSTNQSGEMALKTYTYITSKNVMNMDIPETPVDNEKTIVPETFKDNIKYSVNCYFGSYASRNEQNNVDRYYKIILKHSFQIGSKFSTSILYSDNSQISGNDIEDLSKVKCNTTFYSTNNTIITDEMISIGFAYGYKFYVPLSTIFTDSNVTLDISTNNEYYFVRKLSEIMAFFCVLNNIKTTPFKVVSGERAIMVIQNVFPSWDHEFSLRTYTYQCVSDLVIRTHIICTNCTKKNDIKAKDGVNISILQISNTIRSNVILNFFCYGDTLKYRSINTSITLKIIAYDFNDINDTYSFFMEDDLFNCQTKFSEYIGNNTIKHVQSTSTILMYGEFTIYTDINNKFLILKKGYTSYQGCCQVFAHMKLTCDGNWKDIMVGNYFEIEWSKNVSEIYPNNEIRCYACVNYTNLKMTKCTKKHKIKAFIGIEILKPDKTAEQVACKDEMEFVKSPKQMLKPDNESYYPMNEFKVILTCCVRLKEYKEIVIMKSCNENPPFIKIIPSDKFLFAVGDSFSCSTDMVDCLQGLDYTIAITPEGRNPTIRLGATIVFGYEHVGNRVKIKCSVGIKLKQTDIRIVRVEQAPFNISITGLLTVLWYGRFLKCNAEGFPKPDISWIQTKGLSLLRISEYFLLIGPWDFSGNYTVICEARNTRGVISKKVTFGNYNSRIRFYETSEFFYIIIPVLTLLCVILMVSTMLLTFQEVFFGVPFFSSHKAKSMKIKKSDKSKTVESKLEK